MNEVFIDNFAGGGGASTGIAQALGVPVFAALNHDPEALALHRINHPDTLHYREDIRHADPVKVSAGRAVGGVWFSPDCKHFSKAKGGKPLSKHIRGLAWAVINWVNKVSPRVIFLENVEEFRSWCPLKRNGRPSRWRAAWFFKCFNGALRRRGYEVDWREIRACVQGAPTIRKRFYLVARRDGRSIVWPEASHARFAPLGSQVRPFRVIAECLDVGSPCPSIFLTKEEGKRVRAKRPLVRATLARLAQGVDRYVLKNPAPYLIPIPGAERSEGNAVANLLAPVISYAQHGGAVRSVRIPSHTIAASRKDQNQVVVAQVVTPRREATAMFVAQHNGGKNTNPGHDLRQPASTIACRGSQQQLVGASIALPPSAAVDSPLNGSGEYADFLSPNQLAGARRVAHFLRSFGVEFEGEFATVAGGIIWDIGMRMLKPRELYLIQGFPSDYIIDRGLFEVQPGVFKESGLSVTAQIRMCGNSVCPPVARALVAANVPEMIQHRAAA